MYRLFFFTNVIFNGLDILQDFTVEQCHDDENKQELSQEKNTVAQLQLVYLLQIQSTGLGQ